MAAITYSGLQNTLLAACVQAVPPDYTVPVQSNFTTLYPQAISYAENRICRDIVLLATRSTNIVLGQALLTASASRTIAIPQPPTWATPIIIPEGLALITPAGTTNPALGKRVPFDMASLDLIDLVWPDESVTLDPSAADNIGRYWALRDDQTIVLSPPPDDAYSAELTGLYQPATLSSGNPSTYLATFYSDLLTVACMIWLVGALLRNFGAQSDLPQQAVSWEAQYAALMPMARAEEYRRRGLAAPDVAQPAVPPSKQ